MIRVGQNQNKLNNKLNHVDGRMIILWWLLIASPFPFDYIALYNDRAKMEIRSKEFHQPKCLSDFKCSEI